MNIEIYHLLITLILVNILRSFFLKRSDLTQLNCGIVGFSSKNPFNIDKLNYLMYHNSIERGRHSTGIYTPEQGVIKDALPAEEFLYKNPIKSSNVFIGHVRHATVGAKSKENSHPFELSNLIGVHNGTLENHYAMLREAKISSVGINVDSLALYTLLNEDSKSKFISYDTLSKFDGAAALLFTDKRDPNKLYVYRNEDRPLHVGWIGKDLYISSLPFMLKFIGCTDVKQFGTHYLYTIENGKITKKQYYPEYIKPKPTNFRSQQPWGGNSGLTNSDNKSILTNIDKGCHVNNANLKGRWVQWISGKMKYYGDTELFLTQDKWYYVTNYDSTTNYDIFVRNDLFKEVRINKFCINTSNFEISDWAVATEDILYPDGTDIMFNEGDVIEVEECISVTGKPRVAHVFHEGDKKQYYISLEYLRPASDEEASKRAEELKSQMILPENSIIKKDEPIEENPFNEDEQEKNEGIQNFMREVINNKDNEEDKEEERKSDIEELIPLSIYEYALDIIDNAVDEIKELASKITGFEELDEKIDGLQEVIHDCYNADDVAEWYDEDMNDNKSKDTIEEAEVVEDIVIE